MADTIIHDTLKFARHLGSAGVPTEQAEAIAEAINEHGREIVTREYLDTRLTALEFRLKLWVFGSQVALGAALLTVMAKGFGWL